MVIQNLRQDADLPPESTAARRQGALTGLKKVLYNKTEWLSKTLSVRSSLKPPTIIKKEHRKSHA